MLSHRNTHEAQQVQEMNVMWREQLLLTKEKTKGMILLAEANTICTTNKNEA
jgi:hypothetical protein